MFHPSRFFHLENFHHSEVFDGVGEVWNVLKRIDDYLQSHIKDTPSDLWQNGRPLDKTIVIHQGRVFSKDFAIQSNVDARSPLSVMDGETILNGASVLYAGSIFFGDDIFVGEGTVIEPGALIKGPTIIGNRTEIRQGAYIRGKCLIGDGCVVGHTTEIKNSIMLNGAKAGHFAYIGDSILGNNVNLGAGTKLANLKIVKSTVKLVVDREVYDTGLKKFGAILGDNVQTGCNSVTNPGSLLEPGCVVYPNVAVESGYYKKNSRISPKGRRRARVKK